MIETIKTAADKIPSAVKLPNSMNEACFGAGQTRRGRSTQIRLRARRASRAISRRDGPEEKKRGESFFGFFGKLSLKVKLAVFAVAAVVTFGFFGFALPWMVDNHETRYLATSDLKSAVDIDNLSTIDYTYHGIAEKHSTFLW